MWINCDNLEKYFFKQISSEIKKVHKINLEVIGLNFWANEDMK